MPKQLALLLCASFVVYLLRYDRTQFSKQQRALWLPALWLIFAASRSIDSWLGIGGATKMAGGMLDPIFQSGLLLFGLLTLSKRKLNWSAVSRENPWLIVLIVFMLFSVVWSDMPARSFRSWVREIVAVLMALVVITQPTPREALQSLLRRTVYILIPFSILLIKYYPDLGVIYSRYTGEIQWIGVTVQKNSLGQLCLISTFFLIWTLIRRWRGREMPVAKYQTQMEILLLLMTFWLLKGPSAWAASATAMVALGVGLATLFGLLWMRKYHIELGTRTWVVITACIIAMGVITPLVGGSTVTGFTATLGRDATLTGRTEIWAGLLPDLMDQPFVGFGFSGYWTPTRVFEHQIGEAHNGYLDVWLQLGFVGLFFTAMFLLSCAGKAHRILKIDFDWGCLSLCFVLMIVTETIAESVIDSFNRLMMAIVLLLSVSVPTVMKHRQKLRQRLVCQ